MVVKSGVNRKKSCNFCGKDKEQNYMNDSLCKACRSITNKEKRQAKRVALGKLPLGSGRSPYCSKCGNMKDEKHLTSGWCRECKAQAGKERRVAKRLELGLNPLGFGRSLKCYSCNAVKENRKSGYCLACARKKDNEWRMQTGRTKKHRTGLCPCGSPRARYSKSYCAKCSNEKNKQYINANPAYKKHRYKRDKERVFKSPEKMQKYKARSITNNAVRVGFLMKKPCEVCGINKVEAHHDDYSMPLNVRWLCKAHHVEHHNLITYGDKK